MYTFKREYQVNFATLDEIWAAFTSEKEMEAWNGENVTINQNWKTGLRMEFGGVRIWAENVSTRRPKLLEQKWEFIDDDWSFTSFVSLRFSQMRDGVYIELSHTDIPDERKDEIEEFWREEIIGELQNYFRIKRRDEK